MNVSSERVLSAADVAAFYPVYVQALKPLVTQAAARHLLSANEFAREMADPRIEKVVVRDEHRHLVAMTTVTNDLSAVEWINADYYRTRYPDAAAHGTLLYLGYTLVQQTRRRSHALRLMIDTIKSRIAASHGVLGYDLCVFNDTYGIGRHTSWIFGPSSEIDRLDTQTYYAADYRHGGRADKDSGGVSPPRGAALRTVTLAERPELAASIPDVLAARWPTFMLAGRPGHEVDLDDLLLDLPAHQILLLDDDDQLLGVGVSVPLDWDGTAADLPDGWDDAVTRAAGRRRIGCTPTAACALSVTLMPQVTGAGVAGRVITAMRTAAEKAGGSALIAPVRPVLKSRYPLIEMVDYLTWRTAEGADFDPWLRLHRRLGAEAMRVAPTSMRLSGTVEDWRSWTGMDLPGPGSYVIPGGLSPLVVDADGGTYREPNVWMVHRVGSAQD